jgi:hypothetical protein
MIALALHRLEHACRDKISSHCLAPNHVHSIAAKTMSEICSVTNFSQSAAALRTLAQSNGIK